MTKTKGERIGEVLATIGATIGYAMLLGWLLMPVALLEKLSEAVEEAWRIAK